MVTKLIEWTIYITPQNENLYTTESILNTQSEEYESFIDSITMMMEDSGFYNIDEHNSNQTGSNSMYYTYLRLDDNGESTQVVIYIRISDHKVPNREVRGKNTTSKQRVKDYLDNTLSTQIMQDFKSPTKPLMVPVDIIFDDNHFMSYTDALKYICKKIEEL